MGIKLSAQSLVMLQGWPRLFAARLLGMLCMLMAFTGCVRPFFWLLHMPMCTALPTCCQCHLTPLLHGGSHDLLASNIMQQGAGFATALLAALRCALLQDSWISSLPVLACLSW